MSNQSTLHAAIRASTGTTGTLNEDWLALFADAGVTTGTFDERMLAYLNGVLVASHASLPAAQNAYAAASGVANWNAVTALL